MLKRISIVLIILTFICTALFIVPHEKIRKVTQINTPCNMDLDSTNFVLKDFECFDDYFSDKNKKLAKFLGISESEAFIFGNLGKYWAKNLIEGRNVYLHNNDLQYFKYSYTERFKYSGYCFQNGNPCSNGDFEYQLGKIKKGNYKVLDLDTDKVYDIDKEQINVLKNYLVLRKSHLPRKNKKVKNNSKITQSIEKPVMNYTKGALKVFLTDSTTTLKPDRNCSTDVCKEILSNIENSKHSIDIAIYGYSSTPAIEIALKNAINRGVKVRLIYDSDTNGGNIYPDTGKITALIKENTSDKNSPEANNIMHNKFFIFDEKILITGSANLSHTDLSGYNSNAIIVLNSSTAAKIYKAEFEQMFEGKYHNSKSKTVSNKISETISVYFSPQDQAIANAVIPLLKNAKTYIYIPTFVLTEKRVTEELIQAYSRGIDVKIIADAVNASTKHTKIKELRNAGIPVKIENYAGKSHSKSIIVDDKEVIIGSMNFSNSGENRNDENLLLIKDSELAKFYKTFFLYQWNRIDNKWLSYTPKAEGKDSIGSCSDGLDNDYDGQTDSNDSNCK